MSKRGERSPLPIVALRHILHEQIVDVGGPSSSVVFDHVASDSRRVRAGGLFVAIRGHRWDGHDWIPQALERGAVAVLGEDPTRIPWFQTHAPQVPFVVVQNARIAMARIVRHLYADALARLHVIAITGTKGKTTTVHWIHHTLNELGYPCARVGTLGMAPEFPQATALTTPEADILGEYATWLIESGITTCAIEASSIGLDQFRIDGLRVTTAVFTNLGQDHLDYHGTMEAYFQAKLRLFDEDYWGLTSVGIHGDDLYGQRILASRSFRRAQVWTFGLCDHPSPACAHDVHVCVQERNADGLRGVISGLGLSTPLPWSTRLRGRFNALNFAAAFTAMAHRIPVDRWPEMVKHMSTFPGAPGRMETFSLPEHRSVVIDYAHTPESLEAVLVELRATTPGRLIVLFGCGGNRDRTKRPHMGQVAARHADRIVLTDDNPRHEDPRRIVADIERGICQVPSPPPWEVIHDRRVAVEHALMTMEPGDCLLIAGKGPETYQIYGDTQIPYSDRKVVLEWLRNHVGTL